MSISVVQYASNTVTFTSGTTGTATATFTSNVTAGNCLVAMVVLDTPYTPSVSSITTNGTAENWAQAAADSSGLCFAWTDAGTGGGQKVIDVNITFGGTASSSNTLEALVGVYEVSGIVSASPVDKTSTGTSTTSPWSSGVTATTTVANEMWIGVGAFEIDGSNTNGSITGANSPWVNESSVAGTYQAGGTGSGNQYHFYAVSGYQAVGSSGTATYSGTASPANSIISGAVVLTLKGAATPSPLVNLGHPVRARLPRPQFFPRGRVASNKGGPVAPPPTQGPKFYPFRQAVRAKLPRQQFFPRGRTGSNKGTPPKNPTSGAVFRQLTHPVSTPKPQTFSKGRTQSTPPYVKPPSSANPMAIGLTLTGGGLNAWQYIGPVPLTYLQYMQAPGKTLQVNPQGTPAAPAPSIPGLARPGLMTPGNPAPMVSGSAPSVVFTELGPASGYPWYLPVPPPDGRWVIIGGGGQVYDFLHGPEREPEPAEDDLSWHPSPHLAHLPAPFGLIAERIRRRQRRQPPEGGAP